MPWFKARIPVRFTYQLELEAEDLDDAWRIAEEMFERGDYTGEIDEEWEWSRMTVREK